ncbi:hypothetical protein [Thiorhodococcus minor]|uniref:Uncharacterized protein n=1 Tax=Thiorhodococcus minor TaxID=57489 RepID=A0A6M0K6B5_9GAMM|nr:hypothetical protein [Thiorhodococcus minor]NEV63865.1 hypothetical protein [Thiorhodococcus minor]
MQVDRKRPGLGPVALSAAKARAGNSCPAARVAHGGSLRDHGAPRHHDVLRGHVGGPMKDNGRVDSSQTAIRRRIDRDQDHLSQYFKRKFRHPDSPFALSRAERAEGCVASATAKQTEPLETLAARQGIR